MPSLREKLRSQMTPAEVVTKEAPGPQPARAAVMPTPAPKEEQLDQYDPGPVKVEGPNYDVREETAPASPLQRYTNPDSTGLIGGIESKDITMPRLVLIQQSSEPVNPELKFGELSLDRQIRIPYPCETIFCARKHYFEEQIQFGTGQMPRRANSKEEIRDIDPDANLNWGPNGEKPGWLDAADILQLVRVDEDLGASFSFEIDMRDGTKRFYVAGVYTYRGSGYRVFQDSNGIFVGRFRGQHCSNATFLWSASAEKFKGNQYFKPSVRLLRKTEPELVEAIKTWGLHYV